MKFEIGQIYEYKSKISHIIFKVLEIHKDKINYELIKGFKTTELTKLFGNNGSFEIPSSAVFKTSKKLTPLSAALHGIDYEHIRNITKS